jgi:hypothetical protein
MEHKYDFGLWKVFEHDGMGFLVWTTSVSDPTEEVIGCYKNKKTIKRIRRDSVHGKKILELCKESPILSMSENQIKFQELLSTIGNIKNNP